MSYESYHLTGSVSSMNILKNICFVIMNGSALDFKQFTKALKTFFYMGKV